MIYETKITPYRDARLTRKLTFISPEDKNDELLLLELLRKSAALSFRKGIARRIGNVGRCPHGHYGYELLATEERGPLIWLLPVYDESGAFRFLVSTREEVVSALAFRVDSHPVSVAFIRELETRLLTELREAREHYRRLDGSGGEDPLDIYTFAGDKITNPVTGNMGKPLHLDFRSNGRMRVKVWENYQRIRNPKTKPRIEIRERPSMCRVSALDLDDLVTVVEAVTDAVREMRLEAGEDA